MKKSIRPSLLAASIISVLFPLTVHSAITPTYSDGNKKVVIDGNGTNHTAPIIETSGIKGGNTVHDMTVKNVIIDSLDTSNPAFTGMNFKSAISLAGNNGTASTAPQNYGDLTLNVQDSVIKGTVSSGGFSAVYSRTDSANATLKVTSNSEIYASGGSRTHGMLIEAFGADGMVDITLEDGSNISIVNSTTGSDSAAVRAVGSSGGASVKTAANTNIYTSGNGNAGIYTTSGNLGAYIENKGNIDVTGNSSYAIRADGTGSGALIIDNTGTLTTNGTSSHAIRAAHAGTGDIEIINSGQITTEAALSDGISASGNSDIFIDNSGIISSYGRGLSATTTGGNIEIVNSGQITAETVSSHGIDANGSDDIYIDNSGIISAHARGINATTTGGNVTVINTGTINTINDKGILARTNSGNVVVYAENNITTGQSSGTSHNHGIDAEVLDAGTVDVYFDNGTIKVVSDHTVSGGNSIGIASWDGGSGSSTVEASIHLGSNAIIDATEGNGGLQIRSNGTGTINIDAGAEVHGGTTYGINIYSLATASGGTPGSAGTYAINNAGMVDSLSDRAILINTLAGSTLEVNNTGSITGYVTLGAEDSVFNNVGNWDIRNAAVDPLTGLKNKAVAVSDFGAGNDIFHNEGIIRLLSVDDNDTFNDSNEYLSGGAQSINNAGISQAQLTNLNRFENRGIIDLSGNGQAGDVLMITGGSGGSAPTSGGGEFVADGGVIFLDVVLNEGGLNSISDLIVVDNVVVGSEKTKLVINNVGGLGAITDGDGIKIVDVLDMAEAGAFEINGNLNGGIYEYTFHQGSLTNAADQSLFLRATAQQINPNVGSYLANQTAATSLFMHSLHDRLGETQVYENYKSEGRAMPALWLRASFGHNKSEAADGNLKNSTDTTVIHLGGEVANWTRNGNDRYHLGLMGAYGKSDTTTTSKATGSKADSKVDGYGVGAYLTWYANDTVPEGWYTDVWTMYSWFDNETDGADNYDSKSWTTSLEIGYASNLRSFENYHWMIEPQAQLAYNYYSASDIKDRSGSLTITDSDANGFVTRLGMRTYLRPFTNPNAIQPFLEANWIYDSADNNMTFNNLHTVSSGAPENRFEVKAGLQGEIVNNLHLYGHVGLQLGQKSYERYEGQIGLRYRF